MGIDAETAVWLGELIAQAVVHLEHAPGLTIEVEGAAELWVQVLPVESERDGTLNGFILNFPYWGRSGDPLTTILGAGLAPPPGTRTEAWIDGTNAAIWIRPDVPLVGLAHFIGDILTHITGAPAGFELAVSVEYGY